jgi:hypothetical protein
VSEFEKRFLCRHGVIGRLVFLLRIQLRVARITHARRSCCRLCDNGRIILLGKSRIGGELPTGPKDEKRPADVIGNAVKVMRIATGEEAEELASDGKNAAAVLLVRHGLVGDYGNVGCGSAGEKTRAL